MTKQSLPGAKPKKPVPQSAAGDAKASAAASGTGDKTPLVEAVGPTKAKRAPRPGSDRLARAHGAPGNGSPAAQGEAQSVDRAIAVEQARREKEEAHRLKTARRKAASAEKRARQEAALAKRKSSNGTAPEERQAQGAEGQAAPAAESDAAIADRRAKEEQARLEREEAERLKAARQEAANAEKRARQEAILAQRVAEQEALIAERQRQNEALVAERQRLQEEALAERERQREALVAERLALRETILAEREEQRRVVIEERRAQDPFAAFIDDDQRLGVPASDPAPNAARRPVIVVKDISKTFHKDFRKSSIKTTLALLIPWRSPFVSYPETGDERRFFRLRDISFTIFEGERVAILGTPRSGKTALMRLIAGITIADKGSVRRYRPVTPFLTMGVGFLQMVTVAENAQFNLALNGRPHSGIREAVTEALAFAGLTDKRDWHLYDLEPEERRRLSVACALAIDADVILFDGAPVSKDIGFTRAAFSRLREKLEGKTLVVAGAAPPPLDALRISRGILLDGGQMIFDGPIGEAYAILSKRLGDLRKLSAGDTPESEPEEDFSPEDEFF
jgi:ABC-2 type transport system ATP-binding protein